MDSPALAWSRQNNNFFLQNYGYNLLNHTRWFCNFVKAIRTIKMAFYKTGLPHLLLVGILLVIPFLYSCEVLPNCAVGVSFQLPPIVKTR